MCLGHCGGPSGTTGLAKFFAFCSTCSLGDVFPCMLMGCGINDLDFEFHQVFSTFDDPESGCASLVGSEQVTLDTGDGCRIDLCLTNGSRQCA